MLGFVNEMFKPSVILKNIKDEILSIYPFVCLFVCPSQLCQVGQKRVIFQKAIMGKCYRVELLKFVPSICESIKIPVSSIISFKLIIIVVMLVKHKYAPHSLHST